MVAYVNNQFIKEALATIGIGDLSIQRGYGVFDYFRTSNYVPLFLDEHLERFFSSAKALRLHPLHSKKELKEIIDEMMRQNHIPDSGFRLILTGGYSPDNYEPASPNFMLIQQPVALPTTEKFHQGIKIILHEYMRDVPGAKSINYLMSIYLLDKMRQQHADDILYFNNNLVLEFPRSNVFMVTKENIVATPSANILYGVTRKRVLELANDEYGVEERNITVDELKNAAEIFLTSTTRRILPVVTIDGQQVGDGRAGTITKNLHKKFVEMEENLLRKEAILKDMRL
jgi:branched-chain amino acid aminotransferase